ncbi:MAG: hypothetical protein QOH21_1495 [Acidobacteriota bacterium]|jgi:hypothetical protein|nr:hypothetical protein [Acidobacteriota bacterium]
MKFALSLAAVLLLALPALSQENAPPTTSVLVPVVGSVLGANQVRWKTDLELVNDLGSEVDVALQLPTAAESPAIIVTLGPGQVQRFADVVGEAFGLDSTLSPLLVTTSGRRSVTVRATVYGLNGTELTKPQPIAIQYGASYYLYRALDGIAFTDDQRTNLGLVNLGTTDALFTLALQRVEGRNVAVTRVVVPAGSMWHLPIQMLFPLITSGSDFRVVVETSSTETYAYASVIENATSTARFIQPRVATP